MELTSKQRAHLRSLAQSVETIAQFGKNELSDEQVTMVNQMLEKRELIKCGILESSSYTADELARLLARKTGSVVVATIGRKFVLYRRNKKDPVISFD